MKESTVKLKSHMYKNMILNKDCAEQLGVSTNTFKTKLDDPERFTVADIQSLNKVLELELDEIVDIFF